MLKSQVQIKVAVSREKVFSFMTDTSRWHQWMESVEQTRMSGSFVTGAILSVDYAEGAKVDLVLENVQPLSCYCFTADSKDMTIRGDMRFHEDGNFTIVEYQETIESKSFMMKAMEPFIARTTRRALEKDFAKAREIMEAKR
jgi:hypothetical protein